MLLQEIDLACRLRFLASITLIHQKSLKNQPNPTFLA